MDFFDRWMYKLAGRKIPVFQVIDVGSNGLVKSMTLSKWIRRDNSLLETWHVQGAEISQNHEGLLTYTDDSGLTQPAFAEYKGRTCNIYVQPRAAPNQEKVIGTLSMIDILGEALDLGYSNKKMFIGIFIGMALWAMLLGPMFGTIFS
ncbi:MAG: hypothetical protein M0Q91_18125 [Methanoregula sp.]|nr:hypothetical protein [Methanoregula sp.]